MKQKLNSEALAIARAQLPPLTAKKRSLGKSLLEFTLKLEELKAQAKIDLLARAKQCKEDCEAYIKQGDALIEAVDTLHKEVFANIRAAQPELQSIEFSLDLEEGMYTPLEARDDDGIDLQLIDTAETTGVPDLPSELPPGLEAVFDEIMRKVKQPPQNKPH
jgi:hypothetical protein